MSLLHHAQETLVRQTARRLAAYNTASAATRVLQRRHLQTSVHYSDPGFFFTPSSHSGSPSTSKSPQHGPEYPNRGSGKSRKRVSDQEYNVRVGRAYDLLRATMPDFMRTGLVDYHHDQASQSSGLTLLDVFTFRALRAKPNGSAHSDAEEKVNEADQVYDPAIQFRISPAPTPSSSITSSSTGATEPDLTEEEAASLSFSGRSLYFASAHVLRHTLNILFSNPRVEIQKIRMECRASQPRVDDILHLRFQFSGYLRMTGQEHTYTLVFRYDFDPDTGRIVRHTVEKVEPAIGRKVR
jgi:hypothetical protein